MRLQTSLLFGLLLLLGACSDNRAAESAVEPPKLVPDETITDAPKGWTPVKQYAERAVTTRREDYPSGAVRRMHCLALDDAGTETAHGPEVLWHETGVLQRRTHFELGLESGVEEVWFENGQPRRVGSYVDGKREGQWLEYHEQGDLRARRNYSAGEPHGKLEEWSPRGHPKLESSWDHGAQIGLERRWRGAHLVSEMSWENGAREGPAKLFFDNGDPREEGSHTAGKKNGKWLFWSPGGVRFREVHYADDQMHGAVTEWRPDGSKLSETEYANDLANGMQRAWYADGVMQMEGTMIGRERQGKWTYWRKDGSVNEGWSGNYVDDVKQEDE